MFTSHCPECNLLHYVSMGSLKRGGNIRCFHCNTRWLVSKAYEDFLHDRGRKLLEDIIKED